VLGADVWGESVRARPCLLIGLLCAMAIAAPTANAAGAHPGTLDQSFGRHGRVSIRLAQNRGNSGFTDIVRRPDGKLIVEGRRENGRRSRVQSVIERRGPDGRLDPGFGRKGVVVLPEAQGLSLQASGDILFTTRGLRGRCRHSSAVRRLNEDGEIDLGFGEEGCAPVPFSITQMAVRPDGRIVVAGMAVFGPPQVKAGPPQEEIAVARLLPDGSPDPSFGNGGVVLTHTEDGLNVGGAKDLAVGTGGEITILGYDAVVRFTPTGALDAGFGDAGVLEVDSTAEALLALPGGAIAIASRGQCCSNTAGFVLSRRLPDGSPDPSFGAGGTATLAGWPTNFPVVLALVPDGGMLLAGSICREAACDNGSFIALARFDESGALDGEYGEGGVARADVRAGTWPSVAALTVGTEGEAVVAGGARFGGGDAHLSGFEPDGKQDRRFGRDGSVVEVKLLPSNTEATGLTIEPNGGIVVPAESDAFGYVRHSVLLHLKPNGHRDRRTSVRAQLGLALARNQISAGPPGELFTIESNGDREDVRRLDGVGRPDSKYGRNGTASLPDGFVSGAFLVRPNGAVIVLGRMEHPEGMAVYLLDARGHAQRRFGDDGLAIVPFGREVVAAAESALVEPDGRIVLAGWANGAAAAARLLPDGRPDRDFGDGGRVLHLLEGETSAVKIVRQGKGRVVIAAVREGDSTRARKTILVRLLDSGRRDPSFGRRGVVRTGGRATPLGLFSGDGRIVLVTKRRGWKSGGVVLRAYGPRGGLDRGFGHGGRTEAAVGQLNVFHPVAAAREPNGRIVVAGTAGWRFVGNRTELLGFH
jgi:uncharacterized delta-60 repeat protein